MRSIIIYNLLFFLGEFWLFAERKKGQKLNEKMGGLLANRDD